MAVFPIDTENETKITLESETAQESKQRPFHILLLGDWSGRKTETSEPDLNNRHPIEIDRDNFDSVLKRLNVTLDLSFQTQSANTLSLHFSDLEDFHPDKIFQRCALFSDLRDVRRRLINADTFAVAAREVRSWYSENNNSDIVTNASQSVQEGETDNTQNNLLDQILLQTGKDVPDGASQSIASKELNTFIKEVVKPHLIKIDTTDQSNLLMIVDEIISDLMRTIIHHPQFQALESAWRGAYFLIKRIETDSDLRIYLFDISKSELAYDLKNNDDLQNSYFFKVANKENIYSEHDNSWAVICGNYTFSPNVDDVAALTRIAKIADALSMPFISHMSPEIFGFDSFGTEADSGNWKVSENSSESKLWKFLRGSPETVSVGLSMPRFLIRLPYGNETEPTETFTFEEFSVPIRHEQYLWTNPVFINAVSLAKAFREHGWNISQNFSRDIEGLPMFLYQDENQDHIKPCAEITMTQNNCETIINQGFIPLISIKSTDKVRLGPLQSISYPPTLLKGNWN